MRVPSLLPPPLRRLPPSSLTRLPHNFRLISSNNRFFSLVHGNSAAAIATPRTKTIGSTSLTPSAYYSGDKSRPRFIVALGTLRRAMSSTSRAQDQTQTAPGERVDETGVESVNTTQEMPKGAEQEKKDEEGTASGSSAEEQAAEPLPPLTPAQFKVYNRLAEQMEYFHDHFRQTWTTLYTACTTNRRPANMTLKQFIDAGLQLAHYLETHHSIEETYLYPILARKMPQFRSSSNHTTNSKNKEKKNDDCELLRQHRAIHEGMDVFAAYLKACKSREVEFELAVLKDKMDAWGEVLFVHLDQEVRDLGADVMRRYWTLEEIKAIPM
ncbi:hypothetical protein B0T22DRAFT_446201 [Podospora appendiculata]|uniref:Hemerythrin-like domain-containing protein n=1 Tax=Podospora appendiculata TaxID=314037 RepID=A0AAE0XEL4_9PEZI|nr:hypothetical protein B0T22DRAFT_446201 [Podospora appendiculata]